MLRKICLMMVMVPFLISCKKGQGDASAKASSSSSASLLISPEDILTVKNSQFSTGPVITGTIQPERRADLRAEISTTVLQVLKENGDLVKRGDVLLRLNEAVIRDALNAAEGAVRAGQLALEQSERQIQRLKSLSAQGMTSAQSLEDAENRRNAIQSDLLASRSRLTQAQQQIQHTTIRAPFDGIVSDRRTSAGDTVNIGKELMKVIDPASMRFEGRVSADKLDQVQVGQAVSFRISGYGQRGFAGKVTKIDPAANPVTRQVEVLVNFTDGKQPKVSGLYAEGRINTESRNSLSLPETVIFRDKEKALVWKLDKNTLRKVEIKLGERDSQRGEFEVREGLQAGDQLIRNPQITFKDGDKFQATTPSGTGLNASTSTGK
jgi:membrane fusion protein, multidrug efflux system